MLACRTVTTHHCPYDIDDPTLQNEQLDTATACHLRQHQHTRITLDNRHQVNAADVLLLPQLMDWEVQDF